MRCPTLSILSGFSQTRIFDAASCPSVVSVPRTAMVTTPDSLRLLTTRPSVPTDRPVSLRYRKNSGDWSTTRRLATTLGWHTSCAASGVRPSCARPPFYGKMQLTRRPEYRSVFRASGPLESGS